MADHYHSASEHGIIGRQIETIVARRIHGPKAYAVLKMRWGPGGRGWENGGDEAADG